MYGFSMAPIAQEIREAQKGRANVLAVEPSDVLTHTVTAKVRGMCERDRADLCSKCLDEWM